VHLANIVSVVDEPHNSSSGCKCQVFSYKTEWGTFSREPKSKNYQDGKDEEGDRRDPITRGRSVYVHGTIPLRTSVTLLTAIAVCHKDVNVAECVDKIRIVRMLRDPAC
jgi:hypothetical protein